MGGSCGAYRGEAECIQRFGVEPKGKNFMFEFPCIISLQYNI